MTDFNNPQNQFQHNVEYDNSRFGEADGIKSHIVVDLFTDGTADWLMTRSFNTFPEVAESIARLLGEGEFGGAADRATTNHTAYIFHDKKLVGRMALVDGPKPTSLLEQIAERLGIPAANITTI